MNFSLHQNIKKTAQNCNISKCNAWTRSTYKNRAK